MKQLTQQQLEQVYREHPEWALELEVGKWYNRNGWLLCYAGLDHSIIRAYGIDLSDGEWSDEANFGWSEEGWTPASDAEVAEALIAEARKRGFKAGVEINNASLGFHDDWQKIEGDGIEWKGGHLNLGSHCTSIFHDGHWADVRKAVNTVEVGKWYKAIVPMSGTLLFFCTKIVTSVEVGGYGFGFSGKWYDGEESGNFHHGGLAVEANNEEVEAALIAEAKWRYRDGDKIKAGIKGNGDRDFTLTGHIDNCTRFMRNNILTLSRGYENECAAILFRDGKWATVVTPTPTLSEDIKALKDKYPGYNWTIVAEGK